MPRHQHTWRMHDEVKAPVGDPPGHTTFMFMVCDACRSVTAFPLSNWDLVNRDWRERAVAQWREDGVTFVREG